MNDTKEDSLSVDQHCAMLTGYMSDRMKDMHGAFKHFIQIFSAIVGGSLVLRLQYGAENVEEYALHLVVLVTLAAAVSAFVMRENFRAWKGYRDRLTELAGEAVIKKREARAEWVPIGYYITVGFGVFSLLVLNPFCQGKASVTPNADRATLYRNSPSENSARVHWATFDANDEKNYSNGNCAMAARLLNANIEASAAAEGKKPWAGVGFWCEAGPFRSEGEVPLNFASKFPTDTDNPLRFSDQPSQ